MVRQGALQFSGLTRHIGSLLTNSGPCYTIGVPDFLLQKNVGVYTIPLHVLTICNILVRSIFKTIQVILCTCYN